MKSAGEVGHRSEDDVITLYGFGRIFPEGIGETKDLTDELKKALDDSVDEFRKAFLA